MKNIKVWFAEFVDNIPAVFRMILCLFIGHKRINGGWDDVELCTRCYQFIRKKRKVMYDE
jgi:hypothetical protein